MKAIGAMLSALLALAAVATQSSGAQTPISISHEITGYQQQESGVAAEYSLHVVNVSSGELREVSLLLVPQPPQVMETATVEVGTLAPRQRADLQLRVTLPGKRQSGSGNVPKALWWKGKAVDSAGNVVLFPVKSRAEVRHE